MQSVPKITNVGEVFSIQHYVIKFVSDLRQIDVFFSPVSSTNQTNRHDMAEILLKVALSTITLTHINYRSH